jgi:hypothetical protein
MADRNPNIATLELHRTVLLNDVENLADAIDSVETLKTVITPYLGLVRAIPVTSNSYCRLIWDVMYTYDADEQRLKTATGMLHAIFERKTHDTIICSEIRRASLYVYY